jgi:hypothetical protein
MHIAQTRLSIATAPREIKEITAEVARRMLDGAPHKPGKIVLKVAD